MDWDTICLMSLHSADALRDEESDIRIGREAYASLIYSYSEGYVLRENYATACYPTLRDTFAGRLSF